MKSINRRKFIASSAAVSAITILKPSTVFGTKANSAIRVGIIGCGNRGSSVISSMSKNTSMHIIAMADIFDDKLQSAKPKYDKLNTDKNGVLIAKSKMYQGSTAYKKLLADPDVDAVLISSPAYTHPEFLDAAVMANKHVYCEKPVSPDVDGCKKVIRAGEKAEGKVSVAIGFQIRHASPYVEMVKRIQQGDIGEMVTVQLSYISSGGGYTKPLGSSKEEEMIRNHFLFPKLSGGILLDQGIHMIDVCNWALNEKPLDAIGNGNRNGSSDIGSAFSNYQVIYDYPKDVNVSIHSTKFGPTFGGVFCRFIGTKGIAEAHYRLGVFINGENSWDSGIVKGGEPTPEQRASGAFTSALHDATPNKVKSFINSIESGNLLNEAKSGATSTLSAILGRTSATSGEKANWDRMIKLNHKYDLDLNLSQFDK